MPSKLYLGVPVPAFVAAKGDHNNLSEEGDVGEQHGGGSILLAVDAQALDCEWFVAGFEIGEDELRLLHDRAVYYYRC